MPAASTELLLAVVGLLLAVPASVVAQTCAPGQYVASGVCTTCPAGKSSPNQRTCFYCHDNSGVWEPGRGGRGFVRQPNAANCTSAERVCSAGQYISSTGVCTSCTGNAASPDWVACVVCSNDTGVWPAGRGGPGYVKVASALACQLASTACLKGQYASAGACTSCGAGQSSPDGVVCRSCSEPTAGVWPAGQGGAGFVKSSANQTCVRASSRCAQGQVAANGVCTNCGAGMSGLEYSRCVYCNEPGVWPAGSGGPGWVKSTTAQTCVRATSSCSGKYSMNGACATCPTGTTVAADGSTCLSPTCSTNCTALSNDCRTWACNTATLTCVITANRTGNACGGSGVCSNGECTCSTNCASLNTDCRTYTCSAATKTCVVATNRTGTTCGGTGTCSNGECVPACTTNCATLNTDCRNYTCSAGTCVVATNRTGNACGGTGTCSNGVCVLAPTCTTNCATLNTDCRNYTCSGGTCVVATNRTGNACGGTGTCSNGVCVPAPTCTTNCASLNTDCRNYTCSAGTCVVAANRTGNSCNATQGVCSAAGVCVAKNNTNTGVIPPDSATWPYPDRVEGGTILRIKKAAGMELVDDAGNTLEPQWMHLHFDGDAAGRSVTLTIEPIDRSGWPTGTTPTGIQVRYTAQDVPISPWLTPATWTYTLTQDSPWLSAVKDGVLDLSLQVMGATRMDYRPWPAFLHLKRGRILSPLVPVMVGDNPTSMGPRVPQVTRVARSERVAGWSQQGYPANPNLTPWSTPPYSTNLYLEQLTPGGALFEEMQMWWEDLPSHPNLTFIRGVQPYQGEDPRGINHSRLPVQDGPRGVGWVSGYISGKVDNTGRLVFAELAGRVGWLKPIGEITTIAGWVTKPGMEPVWIRKSLSVVQGRQQLRGTGTEFQNLKGFDRPIDTAFDPAAPGVIYVSDFGHHIIWRLTILAGVGPSGEPNVQVDILAGSPTGAEGYANGVGTAARFKSPFGIAWARDKATNASVLYVADSGNHAIRRIDLATGTVSTLFGDPNIVNDMASRQIDPFSRDALRAAYPATVTATQVAGGARPRIYWPFALRTDSLGNIILLEHSFAYIRRLDPAALTSVVIGPVDELKFGEWDHGWAWLDVDTTGAAGPVNGIYWCVAVGSTITGVDGYHFNEVFAWVPNQANAQSNFIFTGRGGGANPGGFGARDGTTPPHYPWLVAVDPRGGVLMSGMGVHGISRLRLTDSPGTLPERDPTATEDYYYWLGDGLFDGWGTGPNTASLAFRAGNSGHGMLGIGVDGWATRGFKDDPGALLEYYGATNITGDDRTNLLAFLSKQTGPARDALPTAAPDSGPPTVPTGLSLTVYSTIPNSLLLSWTLSTDDRTVAGYAVQVARTLVDDPTTGAGLFTPANLATALNADLARFNGAWLGNTEVALLEALASGYRYHARLAARDLAGKWSAWSVPVSVLLV